MGVVSNTSPILNLAIINQLQLLRQQFSEVLIPPAVLAELKLRPNSQAARPSGKPGKVVGCGWWN